MDLGMDLLNLKLLEVAFNSKKIQTFLKLKDFNFKI